MSKIDRLRQRLAGRWDFAGRDHNIPDDTPLKDIDKKYGPRGTEQELDETAQEFVYRLHTDSGLGVRPSPLTDDFEANIFNTDAAGKRIQDTESVQGQIDKKGMITLENAIKWSKLRQRIAQVRLAVKTVGRNSEVLQAWRENRALKSPNIAKTGNSAYKTDGKRFWLFGHKIAEKTSDGLKVTNANWDYPKTYDTLRALGVRVDQKGVID